MNIKWIGLYWFIAPTFITEGIFIWNILPCLSNGTSSSTNGSKSSLWSFIYCTVSCLCCKWLRQWPSSWSPSALKRQFLEGGQIRWINVIKYTNSIKWRNDVHMNSKLCSLVLKFSSLSGPYFIKVKIFLSQFIWSLNVMLHIRKGNFEDEVNFELRHSNFTTEKKGGKFLHDL